jgi:phthalate 4,5-cis-dihydrodiol dehydrogenase
MTHPPPRPSDFQTLPHRGPRGEGEHPRRLRLGIAGLGRAFTLMLPTLTAHPQLELVAAADPRAPARERFARDHGARVYEDVAGLCADPTVEAVYVATPHQHHAEHAIAAASHGKHVLVEKPMALTLEEASAMIAAAEEAGVFIVVGHSHSFDAPVLRAREIISGGSLGRVRMITAMNFTDFLYRPRRAEELDTASGGGVLFSQAAHQVDIVRLLGGGRVKSVRTAAGAWDPRRPTEGAYSSLLTFEDGAFAALTYSGYGHFDADELCDWVGETGRVKDPASYGTARRALANLGDAAAEAAAKSARNYGGIGYAGSDVAQDAPWHEHFGLVIASCERGDVRPTPKGVMVYGDEKREFLALDRPAVPRAEVIDELCAAAFAGRAPLHDGRWGRATLEVCLAMLRSARGEREVALDHQVGVG